MSRFSTHAADVEQGHLAPALPVARGYGFEAIRLLETARETAGNHRFGGSAIEALRDAGRKRDMDISRAIALLKAARAPERMLKRIDQVPEQDRAQFRRRMCFDFDRAIGRLVDAAKPNLRRIVGAAAARDAQNWAGLSRQEKDDNWERVFSLAMEEHDRSGRARLISGAEKHVPAPRLPDFPGLVPDNVTRTFGPKVL